MNHIHRWRRRRGRATTRSRETIGLDWCALSVAIWLACLVAGQLLMHLPDLPAVQDTSGGHWIVGMSGL